jgi:hypothetical protein
MIDIPTGSQMKMSVKYLILGILLFPLLPAAQELSFNREADGIRIREGGKDVLFYRTGPNSVNDSYERSNYIHPLYGLDGEVLTEDFPEDHLHHRGIFWAWHQVIIGNKNIGDAWECRNFIWDVREVELHPSDSSLVLISRILWKSPVYTDDTGKPVPFVEEQLRISSHPQRSNYRVIDFEISLLALVPGLTLGGSQDEKGYGGFSARMKMPADLRFHSKEGPVKPEETAVLAANWMNISGSLGKNGGQAGIVIISDNAFDKDRTLWILRQRESMQNAVFPGRTPVPISDKEPVVLRYRLVVYRGKLTPREIRSLVP